VDHFLANEAKGTKVLGAHSIAEMVSKLKKPRRVMMLVKAGKPVDEFIEQLIPHLEPGDIIIDGGNSLFEDTNRRRNTSRARACCTSAPASAAAKKARATAPASCPAVRPPRGRT
jgi:6-phosphogluconate dehydrogenase